MTPEELSETLERIAEQMGDHDPEWAIHDFEWDDDFDGGEISECDNIAELNEYANQLTTLSKWELETFSAAVEYWGREYVDIDELGDYMLYSHITTDYELGEYYAIECGCLDLEKLGYIANYIDFESYGRDIRFGADGGFTSFGWIEKC